MSLYEHTKAVYDSMLDQATKNEREEILFEGYMTHVVKSVGASTKYYSQIRKLLLSPDLDPCITIISRGNSSQPSIIQLHHPPSDEWENISRGDLTASAGDATLRLQELEARIERLQAWRESIGEVNLSEVLLDFESRIQKLERGIDSGKTASRKK